MMNLLSLVARLTLDSSEYDAGLKNSEEKIGGFGNSIKKAMKIGIAGITAASTAAVGMAKQAVSAYANYEQLVGGVETLFGDNAQKVLEDASNAFQTAGMSMNEYMETSIQSAASLINSLGGDQAKAAELMNISITDMADNVNKMGTSMEAVQNAYRGFSRGNFTMLDNLALGFAGTKEGMQELLDKAMKIEKQQGRNTKFSINSYADIVKAIHVVQDEMGITGTTALEASKTISGSLSSLKSAWKNLLTGLADGNADLGKLINDVFNGATTVVANIMPVIQQAFQSMPAAFAQVLPEFTGFIFEMLPTITTAGGEILKALGNGILSNIDILIQDALDLILTIGKTLTSGDGIKSIIDGALYIVTSLAKWLGEYSGVLAEMAVDLILTLADALTDPDNLVNLVNTAMVFIISLVDGIFRALPRLIAAAPEIIKRLAGAIKDAFPVIIERGKQLIGTFIDGIKENWATIKETGSEILHWIGDGISDMWESVKEWGKDLIDNFIDGIKSKIENLKETVKGVGSVIKDFLGFSEPDEGPLADFHTYAPDMMELFAKGIKDNRNLIADSFNDALDFGVTSVEFPEGKAAEGQKSAGYAENGGGTIHLSIDVLNEIDGAIFSRKTYDYFVEEGHRRGPQASFV